MGITNDFITAKHYFEQWIALQKSDDLSHNTIGFFYLQIGDLATAEPYLLQAIASDDCDSAYMNLGHIYLAQKDTTKAMAYYTQSLLTFEDKTMFWEGMDDDLQYLMQYGISTQAYEQILTTLRTQTD
jgi:uncharacterized protein HemY